MDGGTNEKRMRLRYAGTCRLCGVELPAKAEAVYERATKTVRCISHEENAADALPVITAADLAVPEVVDPKAGASARRSPRPHGRPALWVRRDSA